MKKGTVYVVSKRGLLSPKILFSPTRQVASDPVVEASCLLTLYPRRMCLLFCGLMGGVDRWGK